MPLFSISTRDHRHERSKLSTVDFKKIKIIGVFFFSCALINTIASALLLFKYTASLRVLSDPIKYLSRHCS